MPLGRILAIDYGERRIGLALSDPMRIIAASLMTLTVHSDDEAVQAIAKEVVKQNATLIVLGWPLEKSGTAGSRAVSVLAFREKLAQTVTVPIEMLDERLSTVSAKRMLIESETKKKRRTKERLDSLAATVILRHYLDRLANPTPE